MNDEEIDSIFANFMHDMEVFSSEVEGSPTDADMEKLDGIYEQYRNEIKARDQQIALEAQEYQTNIRFIRTLSNGKEIWGIRIAHEGLQIYGDIANSEEEAKQKLETELATLKQLQTKQPKPEETFELKYCPICNQMTNHQYSWCMKHTQLTSGGSKPETTLGACACLTCSGYCGCSVKGHHEGSTNGINLV